MFYEPTGGSPGSCHSDSGLKRWETIIYPVWKFFDKIIYENNYFLWKLIVCTDVIQK